MNTIARIVAACTTLILTASLDLNGAIIGNVPFDQMKSSSSRIVAGAVVSTEASDIGAAVTIAVSRTYRGAPAEIVTAKLGRRLPDIDLLRSVRGIFMIGADGALIGRTGSESVSDYFVPVNTEPVSMDDNDSALCIDWMRGLTAVQNSKNL